MCCFSGPFLPLSVLARLFGIGGDGTIRVSATNLFARMIAPGVQGLAYSMNLDTRAPVAMILPIPVAPGTDAIEFIDLSPHPEMFIELAHLFVMPGRKGGFSLSLGGGARVLPVFTVGSFVASFVPGRADFARLDPRFRLEDGVLDQLLAGDRADYGFAVFQLAPGKQTVHPMAFSFATRDPARLFFPTVHVHDGRLPARARFDHALYFQCDPARAAKGDAWSIFFQSPADHYGGLADRNTAVGRRTIRGRRANVDTWI